MQSLDQSQTRDEQAPHNLVHRVQSTVSPPGQNLEREEIRIHVRRSVNDLPESLRQPLDLVYYKGLKIREAADRLGIPQGTVKSRIRKAIGMLNKTLKNFTAFIPASQQNRRRDQHRVDAPDKATRNRIFEISCAKMLQK